MNYMEFKCGEVSIIENYKNFVLRFEFIKRKLFNFIWYCVPNFNSLIFKTFCDLIVPYLGVKNSFVDEAHLVIRVCIALNEVNSELKNPGMEF